MININTHSSINIKVSKNIYIDPYNINTTDKADYIFITHDHYDHYDIDSINKIITKDTILIVPKYMGKINDNTYFVEPNKEYYINGLNFKTTYSYNINKQYHPKDKGNLGYIINIDNTSYYIAGDTDVLDSNLNIKADYIFIPIGGTFTMNLEEAANYINKVKPKTVIPVHYGSVVGDVSFGIKFKEKLSAVNCQLYIK